MENNNKPQHRLETDLPYDPEIPVLDIYPEDMNSSFQRYLHHRVYATLHNSQNTESTKVSLIRWKCGTHKHIYTMECYFHKKNEILSLVAKWMALKDIVLNEISQTNKNTASFSKYLWLHGSVAWEFGESLIEWVPHQFYSHISSKAAVIWRLDCG